MVLWSVYLTLCLLTALNAASVEKRSPGSDDCANCESGWFTIGCRCFKFFKKQQMWSDAEKFCQQFGANLASIHTLEEYLFLEILIKFETFTPTVVWIGGYDAVREGVWFWSDGSKMNYTIWEPFEPNNDFGREHCLEMNYGYGDWNDDDCSLRKPLLCAKRSGGREI